MAISLNEYRRRLLAGETPEQILREKDEPRIKEVVINIEKILDGLQTENSEPSIPSTIGGEWPAIPSLPQVFELNPQGVALSTVGLDSLIKLNQCTLEDFQKVKGIGQKTAAKLVAAQPFPTVDSVQHHVSRPIFQRLREWLENTGMQSPETQYNDGPTQVEENSDASECIGGLE